MTDETNRRAIHRSHVPPGAAKLAHLRQTDPWWREQGERLADIFAKAPARSVFPPDNPAEIIARERETATMVPTDAQDELRARNEWLEDRLDTLTKSFDHRLRYQTQALECEVAALREQVKGLMDPVIRQKMMEPLPPLMVANRAVVDPGDIRFAPGNWTPGHSFAASAQPVWPWDGLINVDDWLTRIRQIEPRLALHYQSACRVIMISLGLRTGIFYRYHEILDNIHTIEGDLEKRVYTFLAGITKAEWAERCKGLPYGPRLDMDAYRVKNEYPEDFDNARRGRGLRISSLPRPGTIGDGVALTTIEHPSGENVLMGDEDFDEAELIAGVELILCEQLPSADAKWPESTEPEKPHDPFDSKNWGV